MPLLSPSAWRSIRSARRRGHYLYIWVAALHQLVGLRPRRSPPRAWWLGVPGAIYALLLRITMLVLGVLAVDLRAAEPRAVADWLRGNRGGSAAQPWLALLRHRLADTWHVLAIIYLLGTFGVFCCTSKAALVPAARDGAERGAGAGGGAGSCSSIQRACASAASPSAPDLKPRFPTLETRTNRYHPGADLAARSRLFLAALALLQAWGFNAFTWLQATATSRSRRQRWSSVVMALLAALVGLGGVQLGARALSAAARTDAGRAQRARAHASAAAAHHRAGGDPGHHPRVSSCSSQIGHQHRAAAGRRGRVRPRRRASARRRWSRTS